ncbi:MAG: ATP-binding cassette domain-containing protein [Actinobacteria bacterium]|nr:MAG: ATP-binding cassette domain-containing protein [Actinomycetota bacterium]
MRREAGSRAAGDHSGDAGDDALLDSRDDHRQRDDDRRLGVGPAGGGDLGRDGRHPRQPGLHRLPRPEGRVLDEVSGGLGAAWKRRTGHDPGQEQHRPRRRRERPFPDSGLGPFATLLPARSEGGEHPEVDQRRRRPRCRGRLLDPERPQLGHRQACDPPRRPLLPRARGEGGDHRPRHAEGSRQRRRLSAHDRELQVEVRSLYREPERQEEIAWGALEFRDVFRIFRSGPAETVALRGLDLRIEPRELVAVFGPSGCGKSTMLHLAAGLDEPSAGEVRSFGRSLVRMNESDLAGYRAREVAVVFQSGNLLPWLSAEGNVALSLRLAGGDFAGGAVDHALDAFELGSRRRQRAGSLSGGEQQRVAIAAAAARAARLVLADEPTAELDEHNEQLVLHALRRLREEFDSSVVVVTHSPRVAEAADRVVEMRDGRTA